MDRLELIQVDVNYNYSERLEGEREAKQTYIYLQRSFFVCWRVAGVFTTNIFLLLCGMIW